MFYLICGSALFVIILWRKGKNKWKRTIIGCIESFPYERYRNEMLLKAADEDKENGIQTSLALTFLGCLPGYIVAVAKGGQNRSDDIRDMNSVMTIIRKDPALINLICGKYQRFIDMASGSDEARDALLLSPAQFQVTLNNLYSSYL